MTKNRVYLYDTTLRDGAQTRGVDFSVKDKQTIAAWLDEFGLDYIEGGFPGANPTDDAFFAAPPAFKKSCFTAFGMTRRPGRSAANDPGLQATLAASSTAACLVGKCWDTHVTNALAVTFEENLDLISSSLAEVKAKDKLALFDAEHFFDGYKANPAYALACLNAAHTSGCEWLVLCDTNGGTLPHEIAAIVEAVRKELPTAKLGIHTHDDLGHAVANSIAAVRAGCTMVQGSINGLGERCGNANLITLIPILAHKLGYEIGITPEQMKNLTKLSRAFDALLDRAAPVGAPFVGIAAFAHKGGLHASAVAKNPSFYEQADPSLYGNQREIIISNQAGQSNLKAQLHALGIEISADETNLPDLLTAVKQREHEGYSYDNAAGSFAVLALRSLKKLPTLFSLKEFAVHDSGHYSESGIIEMHTKANVTVECAGKTVTTEAEGNGPVNALDQALRKALLGSYPALQEVVLTDYHVRILDSGAATGAKTRVLLESEDQRAQRKWMTVGVSTDIIGASLQALIDAYILKLAVK